MDRALWDIDCGVIGQFVQENKRGRDGRKEGRKEGMDGWMDG